jgi:hypothetical protein
MRANNKYRYVDTLKLTKDAEQTVIFIFVLFVNTSDFSEK